MTKPCQVEVFIVVDSCGDYAAGSTENAAREKYEEDVQPLSDCDGFRIVKVTLSVPLPEVVELTGGVPEKGSAALDHIS